MDVRRGVQDPLKGAHQLRDNDIGTGGSGVRERANGLRGNTADNCIQQRTKANLKAKHWTRRGLPHLI